MIHECTNPVPCLTPLGEGYIWYIKANGMFENDEYTIVLCKDGAVKHFTSEQVTIWFNATYDIRKKQTVADLVSNTMEQLENENPD